MDRSSDQSDNAQPSAANRRDLLVTGGMLGGLGAAYGTLGAMAVRYLYPAHERAHGWQVVGDVASFSVGGSLPFRTPRGERVSIARRGEGNGVDDFIALSSTCPHLGCQVHFEPHNARFFCPCHNGTFDLAGKATGGPPGDAGLSLGRYALKIEEGVLLIDVPLPDLACADAQTPDRTGHDACLAPRANEERA